VRGRKLPKDEEMTLALGEIEQDAKKPSDLFQTILERGSFWKRGWIDADLSWRSSAIVLLLEIQMHMPSWLLCLQLYETRLSCIHDTNHVTGSNGYLPLRNHGSLGFPECFTRWIYAPPFCSINIKLLCPLT
jgi:hypothetical protein